ncbi:hypothetical protein TNCT_77631 [Trichonephila clavata]|uniref:Uncharacterized protein n=1 Tax=Trichonephila clavata TaxID=2740835 RepID=A0A8X6GQZ3_TRICU|nr:hypothetical protein TNCT_77631 [Trichonephila clavata]
MRLRSCEWQQNGILGYNYSDRTSRKLRMATLILSRRKMIRTCETLKRVEMVHVSQKTCAVCVLKEQPCTRLEVQRGNLHMSESRNQSQNVVC